MATAVSSKVVPTSAPNGPMYCKAVLNPSNDNADEFITDTSESETLVVSAAAKLN